MPDDPAQHPKPPAQSLPSTRPAPPAPPAPPRPPSHKPAATGRLCPQDVTAIRDAFWGNVLRDMLNALVMLAQQQPELFDGRFAVLTKGGERIPIAEIAPVFAVTMTEDESDLQTSLAVQSTVFRIQTPGGEVFTLPVQEIRALHTMTPALLDRLQREADRDSPRAHRRAIRRVPRDSNGDDDRPPFGLAAFTALPKLPPQPAPDHPTE